MIKRISLSIIALALLAAFIVTLYHASAIYATVQHRPDIECPAGAWPINVGNYGAAGRDWQCVKYVEPLEAK